MSAIRLRPHLRTSVGIAVVSGLALVAGLAPAWAGLPPTPPSAPGAPLAPGDLLVSTSTYQNDPNIVAGQTQLPPGCSSAANAPDPCGTAVTGGQYPYVFNNDTVDGSFGVTSPIVLDEITTAGQPVGSIEVPNSTEPGMSSHGDQMVTSFSSKSELALNLSPDGQVVSFMGYEAPVDQADVSNANTPGDVDPTSADPGQWYRVVAQLGQGGRIQYTATNAFSGDNGRAAITDQVDGQPVVYAAGNAGNGANPEPEQVVMGAGAQLIDPSNQPESAQTPGQPTPIGSFDAWDQLGYANDKAGKDDNFRALTISGNVLYYVKGSGGNGVNTVYFVDTTGTACLNGAASGLPVPGAPLPTASNTHEVFDPTAAPIYTKKKVTYTNPGVVPDNMCILNGFPTASAANATDSSDYPFGIWFANPDTLYVADEGSGDNTNTGYSSTSNGTYSAAAASTTAGLQKWVFDSSTQTWNLAYVLQSGLDLGQPYAVPSYPTGLNNGPGGTGLPWAPATDGLRNLTGKVNRDGTVTIWASTSTVSGSGDQGADPNQLVEITDQLAATTLPTTESFQTVVAPADGTVVRGVSFTPGTPTCWLAGQAQGCPASPGPGGPGGPPGSPGGQAAMAFRRSSPAAA